MRNLLRATAAVLAAFVCVSCGEPAALHAPESPVDELPSHLRAVRAKQRMRFSVDGVWKEMEVGLGSDENDVGLYIREHCVRTRWQQQHPGEEYPGGAGNGCADDSLKQCTFMACLGAEAVCAANTLLEVSSGMSDVTLVGEDGEQIVIPPQSIEVRAMVAEAAHSHIFYFLDHTAKDEVAEYSYSNLGYTSADCNSSAPGDAFKSTGAVMVSTFLELHELALEAGRRASELYVAIASAEANAQSSTRESSAAANQIRQHAAHILAGGREFDEATLGACVQPELPPGAERALQVIRTSAVDPVRLLKPFSGDGALSMEDFMSNSNVAGVCFRYAARTRQVAQFDGKSTEMCIRYLGLKMDDFREARGYLAQEFVAFGRSTAAVVLGETINGDDCEIANSTHRQNCVFAGTSTVARPVDSSFYTGRQRLEPSGSIIGGTIDGIPTQGALRSIATTSMLMSDVLTQLRHRLQRSATPSGSEEPDAWADDLTGRIDRTLSVIETNWSGLVAYYPMGFATSSGCPPETDNPTSLQLAFSANAAQVSDFIAVHSVDALQCATTGTIEGIPCDAADMKRIVTATGTVSSVDTSAFVPSAAIPEEMVGPSGSTINSTDQFVGFLERLRGRPTIKWTLPVVERVVYILKIRSGSIPLLPGSYQSVAAIPVRVAPAVSSGGTCVRRAPAYIPIADEFERKAGNLLAPSVDWCTTHRETCDPDLDDGGPIPLEDPVSENESSFEDSWRHYLDDARRLANFADLLGEKVIADQFEQDRIAEDALLRVSEICGADISLDTLRAAIEADPGTPVIDVLDSLVSAGAADPEMIRLHACLAEPNSTSYVSLGARPVCAWRATSSNALCSPASPTQPCPFIQPQGGDCGSAPSGATLIPMEEIERLGVLDPVTIEVPQVLPAQACRDIRKMRFAGTLSPTEWFNTYVRVFGSNPASGPFSAENLKRYAQRITWHASLGSYSSILLGGRTLVSTGAIEAGTADFGICSTESAPPGGTCDDWANNTLLCTAHSCDAFPGEREIVNARLFRAAIRARWLAQLDLSGFTLPIPRTIRRANTGYTVRSTYNPSITIGTARSNGEELGSFACSTGVPAWTYANITRSPLMGTDFGWMTQCMGAANERTIQLWSPSLLEDPFGSPLTGHEITIMSRSADFVRESVLHSPLGMSLLQQGHQFASWEFGWIVHETSTTSGNPDLEHEPASCDLGIISPRNAECWRGVGLEAMVGNAGELGSFPAHREEFFDALELLCESGASLGEEIDEISDNPTLAELPAIATKLERAAAAISARADAVLIQGLPEAVKTQIRRNSNVVAAGSHGQYAERASRMASAIIDLQKTPRELASQISGLARDMRTLSEAIERIGYARVAAEATYAAQIAEQSAACGRAAASLISGLGPQSLQSMFGGVASTAVACGTAASLMDTARQRYLAAQGSSASDQGQAVDRTAQSAANRADALFAIDHRLTQATADLQLALTEMDGLRADAARELSRALFLSDPTTGFVFSSGTSLRNRLSVGRQRYETAKRNALRAAFLAKRSVEQRFGLRLSSLNRDMSRVDAPSKWESQLCVMEGFDFDAIRSMPVPSTQGHPPAYIGDYITNLELFVESYSRDYPLQEGSDVAVISLRDDVMNVRDQCEMPVSNRIRFSGDMNAQGANGAGWNASGCRKDADGRDYAQCVTATPLGDTTMFPDFPESSLGKVRPFRIEFNPENPLCPGPDCACTEDEFSECGWQPGVGYGQDVAIASGWNRFSFFVNYCSLFAADPDIRILGHDSGTNYFNPAILEGEAVGDDPCWYRVWIDFNSAQTEMVRLEIAALGDSFGMHIDTAGWQLESIRASDASSSESARPFAETGATLTHLSTACEDTDGSVFRSTGWQRVCERLCPTGWGLDCDAESRVTRCFFETQFSLSNRAIEAGQVLSNSGFALGNYNYRTETLSLNFVGSGSRQCADESLPSTCYSSGYIQYSLEHLGPYVVRNHAGEEYSAPLFTGRLIGVKGLASERYISNPISASDQQLLSQYAQVQLRGRPVTGTYRFRIHDTPGVNFDGIEDVQIVLGYRFWTRND